MGAKIHVDGTQYPIVRLTYGEELSRAAIDAMVTELGQYFERARREHKHLATVADVGRLRVDGVGKEVRDYLFVAIRAIDLAFPGVQVCDAAISGSAVVRTIIAAHALVRAKRNCVTRVFKTEHDAVVWANLSLQAHANAPQKAGHR